MTPPTIVRFSFPTAIDFGVGARRLAPAVLQARGLRRPLVVTDTGLAARPLVRDFTALLRAADLDVGLFGEVVGNPTRSQVLAGVEAFRIHGADSIVALGGGAPMDVAKVIALMIHHPGDPFDYIDGDPNARPIDQPLPFLAAIPTTAGTGSEVGRSSVISDDATKTKRIIYSPRLLPEHVLADPELTLALPAHLTAATGMDALAHCVEAFVSNGYHPMCDGIALEGIRMIGASLETCVAFAASGSDTSAAGAAGAGDAADHVQARSAMLLASLMGAVAFQKGLGVTHSLAHALSAVSDVHHGLATGLMLPHAMRFNEAAAPAAFRRMEQAAGIGEGEFVAWLGRLSRTIGLPGSLTAIGVQEGHLPTLLDLAEADPCHTQNPRPVTRSDLEAMFRAALPAP